MQKIENNIKPIIQQLTSTIFVCIFFSSFFGPEGRLTSGPPLKIFFYTFWIPIEAINALILRRFFFFVDIFADGPTVYFSFGFV